MDIYVYRHSCGEQNSVQQGGRLESQAVLNINDVHCFVVGMNHLLQAGASTGRR